MEETSPGYEFGTNQTLADSPDEGKSGRDLNVRWMGGETWDRESHPKLRAKRRTENPERAQSRLNA